MEVSFMPQPLYPCGNSPQNPLDRILGGPLRVWMLWRTKKFLVPAWNQTLAVQPTAINTELSQLHQIIGADHNIQHHVKKKLAGKCVRLTGMLNRFETTLFQFTTLQSN
jgi:hypothetical protein